MNEVTQKKDKKKKKEKAKKIAHEANHFDCSCDPILFNPSGEELKFINGKPGVKVKH